MTNGTYPDTVYDKDMQTVRIVRECPRDGLRLRAGDGGKQWLNGEKWERFYIS